MMSDDAFDRPPGFPDPDAEIEMKKTENFPFFPFPIPLYHRPPCREKKFESICPIPHP